MTVKQAWGAGAIGLICLIIAVFIETNRIRQEEDMRTLMVPVEVTDTQYLALESISYYDAQQAAQIIANRAVTKAADEQIDSFGGDVEFLTTEAEEAISDAYALHKESEEAVKELQEAVDSHMPRTESFVAAEVADVEAAVLLAEIEEKKAGRLTKTNGVFLGPSGMEKYYNLPMDGVIAHMRKLGYTEDRFPYWVNSDGVKMFGAYVMVAADTNVRPKGMTLETSHGVGMVVDHCVSAETEKDLIDIAVEW